MGKLKLTLLLLFTTLAALAQERVVTGVVMDGELQGEPLIGATVSVGDGKVGQGTITDYNGHFTLKVPAGAKKLTVSYVGYESRVINLETGKMEYMVSLPADSKHLSEVVVTGYQKIDRRKLTASVSQLNLSEEAVGAVKNIDQALAGQIAGLSAVTASGAPGAPVKIRIRGTASINGVQEPLWVLDGIPMEGNDVPAVENLNDIDDLYQTSIAGLNPSDIENITVLKDAAATAIYGARAANGVIVITTKKGKEGRPVINFSTKLTYSPKVSIDRLNLLNSNEKVGLELDLLRSDYTYREHKGGWRISWMSWESSMPTRQAVGMPCRLRHSSASITCVPSILTGTTFSSVTCSTESIMSASAEALSAHITMLRQATTRSRVS